MIEAKANLSFSGTMGSFTQGNRYLVDLKDTRIQALVAGGYLSLTCVEEEGHGGPVNTAGAGSVSGAGVAVGVARPQKEKTARIRKAAEAEVSDGQDRVEPARGDSHSATQSVADGAADHASSAGGGKASGA